MKRATTLIVVLLLILSACNDSKLDIERQAYIDLCNISLSRDGNPSRALYTKKEDILIEVTNMSDLYDKFKTKSAKEKFLREITSSAEMIKASHKSRDNIRNNSAVLLTLKRLKFNRFKLILEINGIFYHSDILPI